MRVRGRARDRLREEIGVSLKVPAGSNDGQLKNMLDAYWNDGSGKEACLKCSVKYEPWHQMEKEPRVLLLQADRNHKGKKNPLSLSLSFNNRLTGLLLHHV